MSPHQMTTYDRSMQKLTIVAELQNRIPIDFDQHERSSTPTESEISDNATENAPTAMNAFASINVPASKNVPAAMKVPAVARIPTPTPTIVDPVVADKAAGPAPITSKDKRGCVSTKAELDGRGPYLYKWEYVLFSTTNDPPELPGTFVNREQANAKLAEIMHHDDTKGGMAALTRSVVYEYTPSKLLKVTRTLTNGEERVLWVERRLVNLQHDLTKKERALKKWSANRPKLPLYIVECEFMTRTTTETPQQVLGEESDDGSIPAVLPHEQVGAFSGEIELYRLPLVIFTERELANEHARTLFLEHSRIKEEIRRPIDDYWWAQHAVVIHEEADKAARMPDALYVAEMYTHDMNTRLGFDMIRVAVHAVDDVNGPLNT
ncbi:hypothetical protein F5Y00DRAFT_268006 [Daldinia vernicosa]|uniref:uncharacterized protein n=1 Tax=Daldinia vernicosa TaxID=114800 RepID=UPI0020085A28|nr:uncharacterized protein F5Y00DRAFT_268006 [Daldinia vernicosa]KAI0850915.1 hypothetical protein F5Y00DRAFT_268006 [Daldinia vernicosa]